MVATISQRNRWAQAHGKGVGSAMERSVCSMGMRQRMRVGQRPRASRVAAKVTCRPRSSSKDQLEAELQLPHIDPVEGGGNLAEGAGARNRNACGGKAVGVHQDSRVAPNRMIGSVERFESKLQVPALGEV